MIVKSSEQTNVGILYERLKKIFGDLESLNIQATDYVRLVRKMVASLPGYDLPSPKI